MKTRTVFILGAGSSAPYGLPMAEALVDDVAMAVAAIGSDAATKVIADEGGDVDGILQDRIEGEAARIAERIRRSRADTIDEFIADCRKDEARDIIHGMIDVIWQAESEIARTTDRPKDGGDWIAWLYNNRLLRHPVEFARNNIVFVSFNYERLPRLILSTMMANRYSQSVGACWAAVGKQANILSIDYDRFIHPYGYIECEPRPDPGSTFLDCRYSRDDLKQVCEGIEIMGREPTQEELRFFTNLWMRSERIYFLGLGYHESMLRRIGMTADMITTLIQSGRIVCGTGYGLTTLQRAEVEARMGRSFGLAASGMDCLTFLQGELRDSEWTAEERQGWTAG